MCIWSIHDFPTYGPFARCVIKGLVGCPPYGLATKSWYLKKLKKVIYYGSRWYVPWTHPYRQVWNAFNGKMENRVATIRVSTWNGARNGKGGYKVHGTNWVQNMFMYINMASNAFHHVSTPILGSQSPSTKPLNHN
jgi:hypothetical protein